MHPDKILDIVAISVGLIGAVLNGILLWVINKNTSVEKKCAAIYRNLAVVDIFNCLVIPLSALSLTGHSYVIDDLSSGTNGILYLLFGSTASIPYMMLILLSIARVMIFRYQLFYSQVMKLMIVRIMCILCWLIPIGGGLGIWMCFLLSEKVTINILIDLMKIQAALMILTIITTLVLISLTLILINQMIQTTKNDNWTAQAIRNSETALTESQSVTTKKVLERELNSAKLTFSLFLLTIFIFCLYPTSFALAFTICGPYFNSTLPVCGPFQKKDVFSDPKRSYAITLLSLCGMSIFNSIILLRQKSFRYTMKQLWIYRLICVVIRNVVIGDEENLVN